MKNEELDAMIKEASGPINFTVFLTMFGEKLKGGPRSFTPFHSSITCLMISISYWSFTDSTSGFVTRLLLLSSPGADPEDVIVSAFKVLDPEGTGSIKKEL